MCTTCFWKPRWNNNSAYVEGEQRKYNRGSDIWAISWMNNISLPGREEGNNVPGKWNWLLKGHRSAWLGNGK